MRRDVFWCRRQGREGTEGPPGAGSEKASSNEQELGGLLQHTPSGEEALSSARGSKGQRRASQETLYGRVIAGSSLRIYVAILLFLGNAGSSISRSAMMPVEIVLYNEKTNICCCYPLFLHHYKENTIQSLVEKRPEL